MRETLDLLLRVFPMRSCSAGTFRSAAASGRPCLLGHINKCSAPCVDRVTADEHRQIAADFASFMAGQSNRLQRKLESQMAQASENLEFEKAAVIRDSLVALQQASERNAIVLPDGTDADVIALAEDPLEVAVQIFHIRAGRVRGERAWVADRANDDNSSALIESFILQLYADVDQEAIPAEVIVPIPPSSGDVLAELLSEIKESKVRIKVPKRGAKKTLLDTVAKNAKESLIQHKNKRSSDLTTRNIALEEIQLALGLEAAPLRIECFDISHTQGNEVVASMVVFEDGLPRKSEYRRFIIKTVSGSNDVGAMYEVITRRLGRLVADREDETVDVKRKFSYAPALIVVDGGAGQVAAAWRSLQEFGFTTEIALCGLAKRLEEVWLPEEEFPVILPRTSEGLYLLQR
ncbi:MAG: excinuclease ABC subunit C, partial [Propionibacterium sp.]